MITIQEIFKHKETGRKVVYRGLCIYEDIKQEQDTEGKIYFETYEEHIHDCVLCEDYNNRKQVYAIPILQFMNYYEPVSNYVEEIFSTFEKVKNIENNNPSEDNTAENWNNYNKPVTIELNERHTENICALHSGESEADTEGPSAGVQE